MNFRQRDLTAAVKAVENAGKKVARVEVDKVGNIAIYVAGGNVAVNQGKQPSEWDRTTNDELEKSRLR